ncbi:MAG: GNAT family N-acetyltransferase [Chloroflexota bacterium]
MTDPISLEIHPVTQERWEDFERFFESKGAPHYCWCMAWRSMDKSIAKPTKFDKKAAMKQRVEADVPIGLLAYFEGEPIAWCSIAPRETYRTLGGDQTKEKVWSLACFFVKHAFRNQGITHRLLQEAIKYAKANGARYLEAYPVDPDSPSYRFMGVKPMFEESRFEFIKKAGTRRYVMIRDIQD